MPSRLLAVAGALLCVLVACTSASASVSECRGHVVRWQDGISMSATGLRSTTSGEARPPACRSARRVVRRFLGERMRRPDSCDRPAESGGVCVMELRRRWRCRLYDGADGNFRGACSTGRVELRWRQQDLPPY
ncbi:MAG TPA: hypothetical protein VIL55_04245 [Naasia sp.]